MIYLTGSTRSGHYVERLETLGWGRMVVESHIQPYAGEPWAFDNGAFGCWNNGLIWDGREYLRMLAEVARYPSLPLFGVVPDKVADPDSLRFSLAWYERVGSYPFPWYLAVQDGMQPGQVEDVLPLFSGLFLGGTKRWKRDTAKAWVQLAHGLGKRAHYARCSVEADLQHARRLGYDSADSTFLLWTRERFEEFVGLWLGGSPQPALLEV